MMMMTRPPLRRLIRARWNDAALILKLRMLRLYRWQLRAWYADVWKQEAYSLMCCSGRECGCYGACYADVWESMLRPLSPNPYQES